MTLRGRDDALEDGRRWANEEKHDAMATMRTGAWMAGRTMMMLVVIVVVVVVSSQGEQDKTRQDERQRRES